MFCNEKDCSIKLLVFKSQTVPFMLERRGSAAARDVSVGDVALGTRAIDGDGVRHHLTIAGGQANVACKQLVGGVRPSTQEVTSLGSIQFEAVSDGVG